MGYLHQVQRGIDFIEESIRLRQHVALSDVSRAAGVSHWHFQRIFKALTKETLKFYIRSRRLTVACMELVETGKPVLHIALDAGFDSQASFTRAFKKLFGIPPAKCRSLGKNGAVVLEKPCIDLNYLQHISHKVSLEPVITDHRERHMVGLSTHFYGVDSERNNIGEKLPKLWDVFLPRMSEVADSLPSFGFGIVHNVEPEDELLEYFAAVEITSEPLEVPAEMSYLRIPAARYATFQHRGVPSEVNQTVDYIYSTWLLQSGYRHSCGPDIETYGNEYIANSPESRIYYGIPIS